jgi:UDP-N-acetylglucosamine transferase subunit ALG13
MRERKGTFVTVGNAKQPFDRIFRMVESVLDALPRPVTLQMGSSMINIQGVESYKVLASVHFKRLIKDTSVVIMHAGAGTLIHALRDGQKPIVIPRRMKYGEHIDDHQIQLAKEFSNQNRIYLVENENDMRQALGLLSVQSFEGKYQDGVPMVDKLVKLLENISLENNQ